MTDQKTEAVYLKLCCHLMAERGAELTPEEMEFAALRYADMEQLPKSRLPKLMKTFYDAMRFNRDFRIGRYHKSKP